MVILIDKMSDIQSKLGNEKSCIPVRFLGHRPFDSTCSTFRKDVYVMVDLQWFNNDNNDNSDKMLTEIQWWENSRMTHQ